MGLWEVICFVVAVEKLRQPKNVPQRLKPRSKEAFMARVKTCPFAST